MESRRQRLRSQRKFNILKSKIIINFITLKYQQLFENMAKMLIQAQTSYIDLALDSSILEKIKEIKQKDGSETELKDLNKLKGKKRMKLGR